MRFDVAAARLAALPAQMPAPSERLTAELVDGGSVRARFPEPGPDAVDAAVLALVYPDDAGIARVVLTERVARDGHHSGEVSFPGGKAEAWDAGPAATALREAAEEVALDPAEAGVQVVGELERFWIPVSNFRVTPVVALAERRPTLVASPSEVARILEPPLATFLPDAPIERVERSIRGWNLRFGAYLVDGLTVWGATARVLSQLGGIIAPD
jgi:8-oxo-dGTP pyrophosphatase MutT (NUDIX family)